EAAQETISRLLASAHAGRIYREGARVVIAGRPNVGKSSLLNALLREDRAIVTEIPGTTRDVIEESANIRGIPIRAIDTAGIREPGDPIEAIGVQRTLEQVRAADLILVVLDASQTLHEADQEVFHLVHGEPCVIVANKCDLPVRLDLNGIRAEFPAAPIVQVSAVQGTGLDQLDEQIAETLLGSGVELGNQALVTSARHQAALDRARMALQRACETLDQDLPLELATTDLRDALDALGEITGDTVSEAILAEIFGRFCIGK
ncbi:MAG TPA: GTP-binding protein, partial [Armatimonadota bacterium]|nr:GTP-binding protein [Armatimonadota bacterium]